MFNLLEAIWLSWCVWKRVCVLIIIILIWIAMLRSCANHNAWEYFQVWFIIVRTMHFQLLNYKVNWFAYDSSQSVVCLCYLHMPLSLAWSHKENVLFANEIKEHLENNSSRGVVIRILVVCSELRTQHIISYSNWDDHFEPSWKKIIVTFSYGIGHVQWRRQIRSHQCDNIYRQSSR